MLGAFPNEGSHIQGVERVIFLGTMSEMLDQAVSEVLISGMSAV